jgi:hypothetical protein
MALELATALIGLTFLLAIRDTDSDAFKMLLGGMLTTGFATAVGYYFNSSKGSEDKTNIIKDATSALATSTPVATPIVTTTKTEAPAGTTTTTTAPVTEQDHPAPIAQSHSHTHGDRSIPKRDIP